MLIEEFIQRNLLGWKWFGGPWSMPLQSVQRFFAVIGSFEGDGDSAIKLLEDPVVTCARGGYIRQECLRPSPGSPQSHIGLRCPPQFPDRDCPRLVFGSRINIQNVPYSSIKLLWRERLLNKQRCVHEPTKTIGIA